MDKAEHDHDETLARHGLEMKKKSIDAHDRLARRLSKRKVIPQVKSALTEDSVAQHKDAPKKNIGQKELPKGTGKET